MTLACLTKLSNLSCFFFLSTNNPDRNLYPAEFQVHILNELKEWISLLEYTLSVVCLLSIIPL